MPTVEELEIAYRDQVSAGARAATDSLNKMSDAMDRAGTSADTTDTKITRTTKSAAGWVNSLDNVTRSAKAVERAQADLAAAQDKLNAAVAAGDVDAQAAARALQAQQDKVTVLTQRHADFVAAAEKSSAASKGTAAAIAETTEAVGKNRVMWAYVVDDIQKFVDQVAAGGSATKAAFYQLPSIATNMGGFGNAIRIVTGFLTGPGGLAAGAAGAGLALAGLGVYAEHQQEVLAKLSTQLRGTRDDYQSMAAAAVTASRTSAATGSISLTDARSTSATFAAVPTVGATDLVALTRQAQDLAAVLGKTVPEAAQVMADAMRDPEKSAETFAQQGLAGVSEGLAQQVKALQDSGDKLGAYKLLQDQVNASIGGAARGALTDYQKALEDLSAAWNGPVNGAKSFAKSLGDDVMSVLTSTVTDVTNIVTGLNRLKELMDSFGAGNLLAGNHAGAAASGQSVSQLIDSVGARLGANSAVIDLAHRIQPVESPTGQYDANGNVVLGPMTRYGRAVGAMQVMPNTANGNNLYDVTGNVTAAEQNLIALYQKYGGNELLVTMAYNWGQGNVDKFLAGTASVPQSVLDYTRKVTSGHAYGATAIAGRQGTIDDALRTSDGSTAAQVQGEQRAIAQLTSAQQALNDLHDAGVVSDAAYADQTGKLTQRLAEHKGALLDLRDPMQQLAYSQGLAAQQASTYSAAEAAMVGVDQQVEQAARRMGQAHASAADILAAEARQQAILTGQFNASVDAIDRQTDAQKKLTAGYDGSTGTLQHYQSAMQAAEQARATAVPGTAEYARQVQILTSAYDANAAAAANVATAQQLYNQHLDLDYIKTETSLIGQNSDAVSVQLAVLRARNDLLAKGADVNSEVSRAYLGNVAAIQSATNAYDHQKQVLGDVTSSLSSMADTIADDITQAFINGSGAAVNWGNALKGIETQVISLVAKMALINPIMNQIDGGTRTTLSDVGGILGSLGGATATYSGYTALASAAAGGNATATSAMGSLSGLASLGSLGFGGTLSSASGTSSGLLGSLGLGGIGSTVHSVLGTSLFGTATIGSALGGIGGGMAAGSMLGGLLGKQTNTGIELGTSAAGAALGSVIPGVGTVLGGIGGGLLGGLFGSHPQNPYTIDNVQVSGGQLALGQTWNQAQNDTITAQLRTDIAGINSTLRALGVTFATDGQIGSVRNDPNNKNSALQSTTLQQELAGVGLTSKQASLNTILSTGLPSSYDSVSSFQATIASMKSMADTVDALGVSVTNFDKDTQKLSIGSFTGSTTYSENAATAIGHATFGKAFSATDLASTVQAAVTFADTTYPGLVNATIGVTQTYADQIKAMQTTYQGAITQAQAYGLSIDALSAKQQSLTADMWRQAQYGLDTANDNMQVRYLTATGQTRTAELLQHDVQADADYKQLDAQYQAIYGSAWQSAATYERDRTQLIQTESAERLAIEQKYQDAATAAAQQSASQQAQILATAQGNAGSLLDGITSYTKSLLTDDSSPFTAAQKYQAANHNWLVDLAKAQGGDVSAMGSLTGDASAFLTQSRTYNGSSAQATADYQAVLDGLKSVAMLGAGSLTQAFMTANTQDQTQTLVEKLDELKGVLMDTQQITMQASRRAAMG